MSNRIQIIMTALVASLISIVSIYLAFSIVYLDLDAQQWKNSGLILFCIFSGYTIYTVYKKVVEKVRRPGKTSYEEQYYHVQEGGKLWFRTDKNSTDPTTDKSFVFCKVLAINRRLMTAAIEIGVSNEIRCVSMDMLSVDKYHKA